MNHCDVNLFEILSELESLTAEHSQKTTAFLTVIKTLESDLAEAKKEVGVLMMQSLRINHMFKTVISLSLKEEGSNLYTHRAPL